MRVLVITPPDPLVSLADAKGQLRVRHDDEDATITAMIAAACGHIDGPNGVLGRAVGVQTLEARFSVFHGANCRTVRLPYPSAIDLTTVEWLGADNVLTPGDVADLELLGNDVVPAESSFPWQGGSTRREAVRLRYQTGYQTLPAAIRAAVLLMVGDLYANRETAALGVSAQAIPMSTTVENLLAPYYVYA